MFPVTQKMGSYSTEHHKCWQTISALGPILAYCMVSDNKKRFHEDQEIYLQMLRDANLSVTAIRSTYSVFIQLRSKSKVAKPLPATTLRKKPMVVDLDKITSSLPNPFSRYPSFLNWRSLEAKSD